MFHSCYNGLQFPDFSRPLNGYQFGTKIMAQGTSAQIALEGQKIHAFTIYGSGDDGWVWMNLETFDGQDIKTGPVRLHSGLPESLLSKLYLRV